MIDWIFVLWTRRINGKIAAGHHNKKVPSKKMTMFYKFAKPYPKVARSHTGKVKERHNQRMKHYLDQSELGWQAQILADYSTCSFLLFCLFVCLFVCSRFIVLAHEKMQFTMIQKIA